jgi:hypothetical protein
MARAAFTSRDRSSLALFLLCAAASPTEGATVTKTNEADISYAAPAIALERAQRSDVLMNRFLEEVTASDRIIFDRVTGPASRLDWARKQDSLGYAGLARFNADGAHMFAIMGLDSLRTAAIEALPLDLWEDHWQGWFSRFIAGTIGNPEEEHIQITSISYSAVRSSWESSNEAAGVQWGFRPWRTNPYVYFLAHAGRLDGRPLLTFEGRAGYTLFGSTRVEGRLTVQLPASFRLAGGASFDPARMGSHDPSASNIGVTLEHVVRYARFDSDAVFYVGFRSGVNRLSSTPRQENLIVAGLATRW